MINLEQIKAYFPAELREQKTLQKYILKEYLLLMILDFLSSTKYVKKLVFIGGTNLRLIKGINRFSEDLDFDCKNFSQLEFDAMSDDVRRFLEKQGLRINIKVSPPDKLQAFRTNIFFPELLFDLNLTGHREERFLIKLESQDQNIDYKPKMTLIKGCGFFFSFPTPEDDILCAMKLSAMLSRSKGRDFYDAMFLLSFTQPNYDFLGKRNGVHNLKEFKTAVSKLLKTVNLSQKQKDFEHLLFEKKNSGRILLFDEFVRGLK